MARTIGDMTPEEFSDAIANGFSRVNSMTNRGSMGGGGSSAGGGGVPGWVNTMATGTSNAIGATSKFASGLYGTQDALTNIKQLGGFIGPVGSIVTTMGSQVAEAGITVNKSLNSVAQSGIHLGQNLGLYEKAVLQARMSLPEFEGLIKSSSKSLAGLGFGMDSSALVFLKTAKNMQDTDVAYALKATGTQTEEFGQIMTLVAHNSRQDNLMTASSQKNLIATSLALATEMDNTARLTGISRQEQQLALDKQLKAKDSQLAMMAMDEKQRAAYTKNSQDVLKYGADMQAAVKIATLGGPQNAEETKTVNAIGPEMYNAVERLAAVTGDTKADEAKRTAIKQEMDDIAMRKAADKEGADRLQHLFRTGDAQMQAMASAELDQRRYGQIIQKADIAAKEAGISKEAYIQQELEKYRKERAAAAAGTEGPEGNEAKLGQTLNKVDTLFKDITAGAGSYFDGLNKKVGGTIEGMGNLNTVLRRFTPEQMAGIPDKLFDKMRSAAGVTEAKVPGKEPVRKDTGSLGTVGKLIEDFGAGTDAILHGKEGVITEDQLKGVVSTARSMGKNSADTVKIDSNQFTSMFKNMAASMQTEMPKIEKQFAPMLNGIQSNLRSDLEKAKAQMPTSNTFEKMMTQMMGGPATQAEANALVERPQVPAEHVDAMTDVAKGVTELNKRIERLIMAVEDGHNKSVKAIRSGGNLIG